MRGTTAAEHSEGIARGGRSPALASRRNDLLKTRAMRSPLCSERCGTTAHVARSDTRIEAE